MPYFHVSANKKKKWMAQSIHINYTAAHKSQTQQQYNLIFNISKTNIYAFCMWLNFQANKFFLLVMTMKTLIWGISHTLCERELYIKQSTGQKNTQHMPEGQKLTKATTKYSWPTTAASKLQLLKRTLIITKK